MTHRTQDDGEIVSRTALLDRGLSDGQIRRARERGELVPLLPGLYLRGEGPARLDPASRHRARLTTVIACLAGEPVVSHVSAAIVHGLPFGHSEIPPLHVTRREPGRARPGAPVRVHRAALEPAEVVDLGGVRVTSPERTVVDCALSLPFDHAVVVADAALRRGLVTRRSLQDQLARRDRVPGRRQAGAVLAFADPRSRGPGESFSRVLLHRWGFAVADLAVPVPDQRGRPVGVFAFRFAGHRVVGEFLEQAPDSSAGTGSGPEETELAVRAAGWRLVRWSWPELRSPEPWVHRLRLELARVAP